MLCYSFSPHKFTAWFTFSVMTAISAVGQTDQPQPATASNSLPARFESAIAVVEDDLIKEELSKALNRMWAASVGSRVREIEIGAIATMNVPKEAKLQVMREVLENDKGRPVEAALGVIAALGKLAADQTTRVVEIIRDENTEPYVLSIAVTALGRIAVSQDTNAITALGEVLVRPGLVDSYKAKAAEALGQFGRNASAYTSKIRPLLAHEFSNYQFSAFIALSQIENPGPVESDGITEEMLTRDNSYAYYKAIQAANDHIKNQSIPKLVAILEDNPRGYIRLACIETIVALKVFDRLTVPHLVKAGHLSLLSLSPQNKEVIPDLIMGLKRAGSSLADSQVRRVAARALCAFGPDARAAVTPVIDLLQTANSKTDIDELAEFIQLLRAIGRDAIPAASILVDWLAQDSPLYAGRSRLQLQLFRAHLLETLSHLGTPESALPHIQDALLNSAYPHMVKLYAAAARAAADLGPKAESCIPGLMRALNSDFGIDYVNFDGWQMKWNAQHVYTTAQAEAIRALAKIGEPAGAALPRLKELASGAPLFPGYEAVLAQSQYSIPDIREEAQKAIIAIERQQNEE
jgi:hypothetical protein